jgi:hypothetical protein
MRRLEEITSDAELVEEGQIEPLFPFDPEATDEPVPEELPA